MNVKLVSQFVLLLFAANGAPLVAKIALGDFLARPIDGGLTLPDDQALLGSSKTIRGVVASVLFTAALAPLVGISVAAGALIAATAMAGDLVSSFIKRRMRLRSSSAALGLDQIPESLLPALASQHVLGLGLVEIVFITMSFLICELVLSPLFFMAGIRDRRS
jgi:CDP-diglyceride synthetase